MRILIVAALLASVAFARLQVLETAPSGSELDLADVTDAIAELPAIFARAEATIDLAQMYMLYYPAGSKGRALDPLYNGLIDAARRGVAVRILLDSTVVESNPDRTYRRMAEYLGGVSGIEVRHCDLRQYSTYQECLMHAKYVVVDDRLCVLGSHNWSYGGFMDNRELSLIVEDREFARELGQVFEVDWTVARGGDPDGQAVSDQPARDRLTLATAGPSGLPRASGLSMLAAVERLVGGARRRLDIEVNSFSTRVDFGPGTSFGLVESLVREAGNRGVRVRLLVDHWADEHEPGLFRSLDSLPSIEVRVADIRRAGPNPDHGTVHSKLFLADDAVFLLGTATLSQRQLTECRNVAVLARDETTARTLGAVFERDWSSEYVSRPVIAP